MNKLNSRSNFLRKTVTYLTLIAFLFTNTGFAMPVRDSYARSVSGDRNLAVRAAAQGLFSAETNPQGEPAPFQSNVYDLPGGPEATSSFVQRILDGEDNRFSHVQVYAFDVGGTLAGAKSDMPSPELISQIAALVNMGKHVVIITGKQEKAFKKWIENDLMPLVDQSKRHLFMVYGDRVTKKYQVNSQGEIEVTSTISFPHPDQMDEMLQVAERVVAELVEKTLADPSITDEVKNVLRNDPIEVKKGDTYIQISAGKDIPKSGDDLRKKLQSTLTAALEEAGLLLPGVVVDLQGKKGAFILNEQANKPGAINDVLTELELPVERAVYVADQFAGKSTADLTVADTGAHCVNVGSDTTGNLLAEVEYVAKQAITAEQLFAAEALARGVTPVVLKSIRDAIDARVEQPLRESLVEDLVILLLDPQAEESPVVMEELLNYGRSTYPDTVTLDVIKEALIASYVVYLNSQLKAGELDDYRKINQVDEFFRDYYFLLGISKPDLKTAINEIDNEDRSQVLEEAVEYRRHLLSVERSLREHLSIGPNMDLLAKALLNGKSVEEAIEVVTVEGKAVFEGLAEFAGRYAGGETEFAERQRREHGDIRNPEELFNPSLLSPNLACVLVDVICAQRHGTWGASGPLYDIDLLNGLVEHPDSGVRAHAKAALASFILLGDKDHYVKPPVAPVGLESQPAKDIDEALGRYTNIVADEGKDLATADQTDFSINSGRGREDGRIVLTHPQRIHETPEAGLIYKPEVILFETDNEGNPVLVDGENKTEIIASLVTQGDVVNRLEAHPESEESFEQMAGRSVLYMAEPKPEDGEWEIKAYLLNPGDAIVVAPGVWHAIAAVDGLSRIAITENLPATQETEFTKHLYLDQVLHIPEDITKRALTDEEVDSFLSAAATMKNQYLPSGVAPVLGDEHPGVAETATSSNVDRSIIKPAVYVGGDAQRTRPIFDKPTNPAMAVSVMVDGKEVSMPLAQAAVARVREFINPANVLISTTRNSQPATEAMLASGYPDNPPTTLYEPDRRDTGGAVLFVAAQIAAGLAEGEDATHFTVWGDQYITDGEKLKEIIDEAAAVAQSGKKIVEVAIRVKGLPTHLGWIAPIPGAPESGFGEEVYIGVHHEKPDEELARELKAAGGAGVNTGMICFNISTLEAFLNDAIATGEDEELAQAGEAYFAMKAAFSAGNTDGANEAFLTLPKMMVDRLLSERVSKAQIGPDGNYQPGSEVQFLGLMTDLSWADLGNTDDYVEHLVEPDLAGNRIVGGGEVTIENCANCNFFIPEGMTIVARDLSGMNVSANSDGSIYVRPVGEAGALKGLDNAMAESDKWAPYTRPGISDDDRALTGMRELLPFNVSDEVTDQAELSVTAKNLIVQMPGARNEDDIMVTHESGQNYVIRASLKRQLEDSDGTLASLDNIVANIREGEFNTSIDYLKGIYGTARNEFNHIQMAKARGALLLLDKKFPERNIKEFIVEALKLEYQLALQQAATGGDIQLIVTNDIEMRLLHTFDRDNSYCARVIAAVSCNAIKNHWWNIDLRAVIAPQMPDAMGEGEISSILDEAQCHVITDAYLALAKDETQDAVTRYIAYIYLNNIYADRRSFIDPESLAQLQAFAEDESQPASAREKAAQFLTVFTSPLYGKGEANSQLIIATKLDTNEDLAKEYYEEGFRLLWDYTQEDCANELENRGAAYATNLDQYTRSDIGVPDEFKSLMLDVKTGARLEYDSGVGNDHKLASILMGCLGLIQASVAFEAEIHRTNPETGDIEVVKEFVMPGNFSVQLIKEPVIEIDSTDYPDEDDRGSPVHSTVTIADLEHLFDYDDSPRANREKRAALTKTALIYSGIFPPDCINWVNTDGSAVTLKQLLERVTGGYGIRIVSDIRGVPVGSGLGASSGWSAAQVLMIRKFFGLGSTDFNVSDNELNVINAQVVSSEVARGTIGGFQDAMNIRPGGLRSVYISRGNSFPEMIVDHPLNEGVLAELQESLVVMDGGYRRDSGETAAGFSDRRAAGLKEVQVAQAITHQIMAEDNIVFSADGRLNIDLLRANQTVDAWARKIIAPAADTALYWAANKHFAESCAAMDNAEGHEGFYYRAHGGEATGARFAGGDILFIDWPEELRYSDEEACRMDDSLKVVEQKLALRKEKTKERLAYADVIVAKRKEAFEATNPGAKVTPYRMVINTDGAIISARRNDRLVPALEGIQEFNPETLEPIDLGPVPVQPVLPVGLPVMASGDAERAPPKDEDFDEASRAAGTAILKQVEHRIADNTIQKYKSNELPAGQCDQILEFLRAHGPPADSSHAALHQNIITALETGEVPLTLPAPTAEIPSPRRKIIILKDDNTVESLNVVQEQTIPFKIRVINRPELGIYRSEIADTEGRRREGIARGNSANKVERLAESDPRSGSHIMPKMPVYCRVTYERDKSGNLVAYLNATKEFFDGLLGDQPPRIFHDINNEKQEAFISNPINRKFIASTTVAHELAALLGVAHRDVRRYEAELTKVTVGQEAVNPNVVFSIAHAAVIGYRGYLANLFQWHPTDNKGKVRLLAAEAYAIAPGVTVTNLASAMRDSHSFSFLDDAVRLGSRPVKEAARMALEEHLKYQIGPDLVGRHVANPALTTPSDSSDRIFEYVDMIKQVIGQIDAQRKAARPGRCEIGAKLNSVQRRELVVDLRDLLHNIVTNGLMLKDKSYDSTVDLDELAKTLVTLSAEERHVHMEAIRYWRNYMQGAGIKIPDPEKKESGLFTERRWFSTFGEQHIADVEDYADECGIVLQPRWSDEAGGNMRDGEQEPVYWQTACNFFYHRLGMIGLKYGIDLFENTEKKQYREGAEFILTARQTLRAKLGEDEAGWRRTFNMNPEEFEEEIVRRLKRDRGEETIKSWREELEGIEDISPEDIEEEIVRRLKAEVDEETMAAWREEFEKFKSMDQKEFEEEIVRRIDYDTTYFMILKVLEGNQTSDPTHISDDEETFEQVGPPISAAVKLVMACQDIAGYRIEEEGGRTYITILTDNLGNELVAQMWMADYLIGQGYVDDVRFSTKATDGYSMVDVCGPEEFEKQLYYVQALATEAEDIEFVERTKRRFELGKLWREIEITEERIRFWQKEETAEDEDVFDLALAIEDNEKGEDLSKKLRDLKKNFENQLVAAQAIDDAHMIIVAQSPFNTMGLPFSWMPREDQLSLRGGFFAQTSGDMYRIKQERNSNTLKDQEELTMQAVFDVETGIIMNDRAVKSIYGGKATGYIPELETKLDGPVAEGGYGSRAWRQMVIAYSIGYSEFHPVTVAVLMMGNRANIDKLAKYHLEQAKDAEDTFQYLNTIATALMKDYEEKCTFTVRALLMCYLGRLAQAIESSDEATELSAITDKCNNFRLNMIAKAIKEDELFYVASREDLDDFVAIAEDNGTGQIDLRDTARAVVRNGWNNNNGLVSAEDELAEAAARLGFSVTGVREAFNGTITHLKSIEQARRTDYQRLESYIMSVAAADDEVNIISPLTEDERGIYEIIRGSIDNSEANLDIAGSDQAYEVWTYCEVLGDTQAGLTALKFAITRRFNSGIEQNIAMGQLMAHLSISNNPEIVKIAEELKSQMKDRVYSLDEIKPKGITQDKAQEYIEQAIRDYMYTEPWIYGHGECFYDTDRPWGAWLALALRHYDEELYEELMKQDVGKRLSEAVGIAATAGANTILSMKRTFATDGNDIEVPLGGIFIEDLIKLDPEYALARIVNIISKGELPILFKRLFPRCGGAHPYLAVGISEVPEDKKYDKLNPGEKDRAARKILDMLKASGREINHNKSVDEMNETEIVNVLRAHAHLILPEYSLGQFDAWAKRIIECANHTIEFMDENHRLKLEKIKIDEILRLIDVSTSRIKRLALAARQRESHELNAEYMNGLKVPIDGGVAANIPATTIHAMPMDPPILSLQIHPRAHWFVKFIDRETGEDVSHFGAGVLKKLVADGKVIIIPNTNVNLKIGKTELWALEGILRDVRGIVFDDSIDWKTVKTKITAYEARMQEFARGLMFILRNEKIDDERRIIAIKGLNKNMAEWEAKLEADPFMRKVLIAYKGLEDDFEFKHTEREGKNITLEMQSLEIAKVLTAFEPYLGGANENHLLNSAVTQLESLIYGFNDNSNVTAEGTLADQVFDNIQINDGRGGFYPLTLNIKRINDVAGYKNAFVISCGHKSAVVFLYQTAAVGEGQSVDQTTYHHLTYDWRPEKQGNNREYELHTLAALINNVDENGMPLMGKALMKELEKTPGLVNDQVVSGNAKRERVIEGMDSFYQLEQGLVELLPPDEHQADAGEIIFTPKDRNTPIYFECLEGVVEIEEIIEAEDSGTRERVVKKGTAEKPILVKAGERYVPVGAASKVIMRYHSGEKARLFEFSVPKIEGLGKNDIRVLAEVNPVELMKLVKSGFVTLPPELEYLMAEEKAPAKQIELAAVGDLAAQVEQLGDAIGHKAVYVEHPAGRPDRKAVYSERKPLVERKAKTFLKAILPDADMEEFEEFLDLFSDTKEGIDHIKCREIPAARVALAAVRTYLAYLQYNEDADYFLHVLAYNTFSEEEARLFNHLLAEDSPDVEIIPEILSEKGTFYDHTQVIIVTETRSQLKGAIGRLRGPTRHFDVFTFKGREIAMCELQVRETDLTADQGPEDVVIGAARNLPDSLSRYAGQFGEYMRFFYLNYDQAEFGKLTEATPAVEPEEPKAPAEQAAQGLHATGAALQRGDDVIEEEADETPGMKWVMRFGDGRDGGMVPEHADYEDLAVTDEIVQSAINKIIKARSKSAPLAEDQEARLKSILEHKYQYLVSDGELDWRSIDRTAYDLIKEGRHGHLNDPDVTVDRLVRREYVLDRLIDHIRTMTISEAPFYFMSVPYDYNPELLAARSDCNFNEFTIVIPDAEDGQRANQVVAAITEMLQGIPAEGVDPKRRGQTEDGIYYATFEVWPKGEAGRFTGESLIALEESVREQLGVGTLAEAKQEDFAMSLILARMEIVVSGDTSELRKFLLSVIGKIAALGDITPAQLSYMREPLAFLISEAQKPDVEEELTGDEFDFADAIIKAIAAKDEGTVTELVASIEIAEDWLDDEDTTTARKLEGPTEYGLTAEEAVAVKAWLAENIDKLGDVRQEVGGFEVRVADIRELIREMVIAGVIDNTRTEIIHINALGFDDIVVVHNQYWNTAQSLYPDEAIFNEFVAEVVGEEEAELASDDVGHTQAAAELDEKGGLSKRAQVSITMMARRANVDLGQNIPDGGGKMNSWSETWLGERTNPHPGDQVTNEDYRFGTTSARMLLNIGSDVSETAIGEASQPAVAVARAKFAGDMKFGRDAIKDIAKRSLALRDKQEQGASAYVLQSDAVASGFPLLLRTMAENAGMYATVLTETVSQQQLVREAIAAIDNAVLRDSINQRITVENTFGQEAKIIDRITTDLAGRAGVDVKSVQLINQQNLDNLPVVQAAGMENQSEQWRLAYSSFGTSA